MICRATAIVLAVVGTAGVMMGQEQHQLAVPEKLGKVSFATSCSPSVEERFERGVALLHSFTYQAAQQQFAEVSKADPNCAMAHWGAAMSYYHQLWEPRIADSDFGRGAQEIAQARQLRKVSERETAFIGALGEFYRRAGEIPQAKREQAYAQAMKRVAELHKDDPEAQAFYALALHSIERHDWSEPAALVTHQESRPQVSAITHWGRAVALARSGNAPAAEKEVGLLEGCLEKVRAAKNDYWATRVEIQVAEANAWIARAKGQKTEAVALLRPAATREDGVEKRPITPGVIIPARQQLGELLLELKQPDQALAEFEAMLENAPGRRGGLKGAFQAAELAGNTEKARQYKTRLF